MSLEGRILTLVKELEEEKRLADKRAKQLYLAAGGGFIGHGDTPAAYAGGAGKFVKVNATPDALIFANIAWADVSKTGSNLTNLATRQHAGLTDVTANQHHPQSHSHTHASITSVTSDQHHAASHGHTHASTTGRTANDHHAQAHSHTHASTTGRTANDHHPQSHAHAYLLDTTDTFTGRLTINSGALTTAAGHINYLNGTIDSIGTYNNTTTGDANMRCLSNGLFKTKTSSQIFKGSITDLEIDSALIYQLRPVSFTSKCKGDDKNRKHGLIAEEVEEVSSELVNYTEEGEAQDYSSSAIMALILAETQRHEEKIKMLEAKFNN